MKRKKVTPVLVLLLFLLIGLLQTCKKSEYQYKFKYVDLVQFFPYLTKVFEEHTLKFVKRDLDRSKYILKGFKTYRDQLPRTWAVEKESTIIAYFSHPEDKTVVLRCRPFNPPGQPLQEGDVFINGSYLKKIIFEKKGQYEFHLPANLLHYGSNHMTFKWKYSRSPRDFGMNNDKRKYAVGFSYLSFQSRSKKNKKRKTLSKIQLNQKSRAPGIQIPQGGIVEYFLDLPGKSQLRFTLYTRQKHLQDSVLHLAVYSETGKKIIRHFKNHQFSSQEHQLNLSSMANQTVKIVFSNSMCNHPNFTVSLLKPAVYFSTGDGSLARSDAEKGESGTKKNREQKSTKKKPHVFIYLIDTLRADHLSCYGYWRKTTPYIDGFAKGGILFKNCFATASWTKPAVGSILTGLYPNRHRGEDNEDRLSSEVDTIAEVLKSHGYTTIYITPNVNSSQLVNFDQGIDFYKFSKGGTHIDKFYYSSEYLNSEFIEMIENNPKLLNNPLFVFLHTIDPHDPYTPKEPFLKFKKMDKERENLGLPDNIRMKKAAKEGLSQEDIDYIKSLYDCEILHNDYYFGKLLDFLKEKNLYENSVIVLVADHGEQFDEHGGLFHGTSIYNEEIHVPLIIRFPHGEFSGKQTDMMVSQVDVLPTILDYLGIETSSYVDGISLFNILAHNRFQRSLFVRERLNRDENHKNNFLGIINTSDKIKHIITYTDDFFINALNMESYNLAEDFSEKRDILMEKPGDFRFKSIKFLADYFLEKMESLGFKEEEKVYLETLPPDKIKQLRALGYIN